MFRTPVFLSDKTKAPSALRPWGSHWSLEKRVLVGPGERGIQTPSRVCWGPTHQDARPSISPSRAQEIQQQKGDWVQYPAYAALALFIIFRPHFWNEMRGIILFPKTVGLYSLSWVLPSGHLQSFLIKCAHISLPLISVARVDLSVQLGREK